MIPAIVIIAALLGWALRALLRRILSNIVKAASQGTDQ